METKRKCFETFLINSAASQWDSSKRNTQTIKTCHNTIYFLPNQVESIEIGSLRNTFTPLEVSNLLKLLPPKIDGAEIQLTTSDKNDKYRSFSVFL